MYIETRTRAIIKTISWRILATFTTAAIVFFLVGRIEVAAMAGGVEMVLKIILYYFHERIWNKVHVGKHQIKPFVLWFTGLSGSGKSTLASEIYKYLKDKGFKTERLDGDTIRDVFPKTGFSKEERDAHVKRVGFLAGMLEKNGIIVISSLISPYQDTRQKVRELCDNFIEIYVDTSLEECERRDVKGLYKKARQGEIRNFTGIDDPYEKPDKPEITVKTENKSVQESAEYIITQLKKKNIINNFNG